MQTGQVQDGVGQDQAIQVLSRPSARMISKSGTSSVISGKVETATMADRIRSRAGICSRARA